MKKEGESDSEDSDEHVDPNSVNPKLAAKYSFLFKKREDMTPAERRWKWVKKEALPKELADLI